MEQKQIDMAINAFREYGGFLGDSEFGHLVTPRIAPRDIKGIVLKPIKRRDLPSNISEQLFQKKLSMVVSAMKAATESNRPLILPVYDEWGNLRWPKFIASYEVKKFVAERDAKKQSPNP